MFKTKYKIKLPADKTVFTIKYRYVFTSAAIPSKNDTEKVVMGATGNVKTELDQVLEEIMANLRPYCYKVAMKAKINNEKFNLSYER